MPMNESVSLVGKSFVVTRPAQQATGMIALLQGCGAEVLAFPTLDIVPKALLPGERAMVENLSAYQHIICVSANAATLGLEILSDYWPQWPVDLKWFAVGPATAEAMAGWGLEVITPEASPDSDSLLAMSELQSIEEQKILIVRGVGGRELLAEGLRKRGAQIDYLEVYERKIPSCSPDTLLEFIDTRPEALIITTSGESIRNLLHIADGFDTRVKSHPLLVVSERTVKFAHSLGFKDVYNAKGASNQSILKAIISISG